MRMMRIRRTAIRVTWQDSNPFDDIERYQDRYEKGGAIMSQLPTKEVNEHEDEDESKGLRV